MRHRSNINRRILANWVAGLTLLLGIAGGGLAADTQPTEDGLLRSAWRGAVATDGEDGLAVGSFSVSTRRPVFLGLSDRIGDAAAAKINNLPLQRWTREFLLDDTRETGWQQTMLRNGWQLADVAGRELLLTATEGARASGFIRTLDFDLESRLGGRNAQAGINLLGALAEREDHAIAWQLRAYKGDKSRDGGNIGVLARRAVQEVMVGGNVFLDYETHDADNFLRWSVGGELRSAWIDVFANYYTPITDPVSVVLTATSDKFTYSAQGYDVEVNVHSPSYPWLSGVFGHYSWDGKYGQKDDKGSRLGIRLNPVQLPLSAEILWDSSDGDRGSSDKIGGKISYRHRFGAAQKGGGRATEFRAQDWFFTPAEREYSQRIREYERDSSSSQIAINRANFQATIPAQTRQPFIPVMPHAMARMLPGGGGGLLLDPQGVQIPFSSTGPVALPLNTPILLETSNGGRTGVRFAQGRGSAVDLIVGSTVTLLLSVTMGDLVDIELSPGHVIPTLAVIGADITVTVDRALTAAITATENATLKVTRRFDAAEVLTAAVTVSPYQITSSANPPSNFDYFARLPFDLSIPPGLNLNLLVTPFIRTQYEVTLHQGNTIPFYSHTRDEQGLPSIVRAGNTIDSRFPDDVLTTTLTVLFYKPGMYPSIAVTIPAGQALVLFENAIDIPQAVLPAGATITAGTVIPNYPIVYRVGDVVPAGTILPTPVVLAAGQPITEELVISEATTVVFREALLAQQRVDLVNGNVQVSAIASSVGLVVAVPDIDVSVMMGNADLMVSVVGGPDGMVTAGVRVMDGTAMVDINGVTTTVTAATSGEEDEPQVEAVYDEDGNIVKIVNMAAPEIDETAIEVGFTQHFAQVDFGDRFNTNAGMRQWDAQRELTGDGTADAPFQVEYYPYYDNENFREYVLNEGRAMENKRLHFGGHHGRGFTVPMVAVTTKLIPGISPTFRLAGVTRVDAYDLMIYPDGRNYFANARGNGASFQLVPMGPYGSPAGVHMISMTERVQAPPGLHIVTIVIGHHGRESEPEVRMLSIHFMVTHRQAEHFVTPQFSTVTIDTCADLTHDEIKELIGTGDDRSAFILGGGSTHLGLSVPPDIDDSFHLRLTASLAVREFSSLVERVSVTGGVSATVTNTVTQTRDECVVSGVPLTDTSFMSTGENDDHLPQEVQVPRETPIDECPDRGGRRNDAGECVRDTVVTADPPLVTDPCGDTDGARRNSDDQCILFTPLDPNPCPAGYAEDEIGLCSTTIEGPNPAKPDPCTGMRPDSATGQILMRDGDMCLAVAGGGGELIGGGTPIALAPSCAGFSSDPPDGDTCIVDTCDNERGADGICYEDIITTITDEERCTGNGGVIEDGVCSSTSPLDVVRVTTDAQCADQSGRARNSAGECVDSNDVIAGVPAPVTTMLGYSCERAQTKLREYRSDDPDGGPAYLANRDVTVRVAQRENGERYCEIADVALHDVVNFRQNFHTGEDDEAVNLSLFSGGFDPVDGAQGFIYDTPATQVTNLAYVNAEVPRAANLRVNVFTEPLRFDPYDLRPGKWIADHYPKGGTGIYTFEILEGPGSDKFRVESNGSVRMIRALDEGDAVTMTVASGSILGVSIRVRIDDLGPGSDESEGVIHETVLWDESQEPGQCFGTVFETPFVTDNLRPFQGTNTTRDQELVHIANAYKGLQRMASHPVDPLLRLDEVVRNLDLRTRGVVDDGFNRIFRDRRGTGAYFHPFRGPRPFHDVDIDWWGAMSWYSYDVNGGQDLISLDRIFRKIETISRVYTPAELNRKYGEDGDSLSLGFGFYNFYVRNPVSRNYERIQTPAHEPPVVNGAHLPDEQDFGGEFQILPGSEPQAGHPQPHEVEAGDTLLIRSSVFRPEFFRDNRTDPHQYDVDNEFDMDEDMVPEDEVGINDFRVYHVYLRRDNGDYGYGNRFLAKIAPGQEDSCITELAGNQFYLNERYEYTRVRSRAIVFDPLQGTASAE